jgi:DNA repair protein RadD
MAVILRPYQADAIERVRQAIRDGARNILICAPTGSGKTVIASHITDESQKKNRRSAFVVDRLSLIQQTSDTFDRYGIQHGVIQADHVRFRPSLPVQICSIQTIARRMWPEAHLIIHDECHTVSEIAKAKLLSRDCINIGLTATPFTKSLGKYYDVVINVTTTNQLIADGFLSTYRIFAGVEPDMEGVKVVAGEYEEKETEKRALKVVGDVVVEYLKHGEGRKFICSAVNTAHVEELQRQFLAAGINAATYTYKDRDEDRADTVYEFRKPDSNIKGLITVTAASKGFDVPDIACVIMARPLRKSLAEHIQFFGRGLRIAEGKTDCLILDHSGNCERFWDDWNLFFELGCDELDDGKKRDKPKPKPKEEAELMKCPTCRRMHKVAPFCPACGHEYPKRLTIEHVPGTLKELVATGNSDMMRKHLWPQVVAYVQDVYEARGYEAAQKKAQAIYKELTGGFALGRVDNTKPVAPTRELVNKIKSNTIRWARSKKPEDATV